MIKRNEFNRINHLCCCGTTVLSFIIALMLTESVSAQSFTTLPMIAVGGGHSVALKSDGTVWAWGLNVWGQLGDGTTTNHRTPVQVSGLTRVTAIAAGMSHTVALKSDGTVWAWGANSFGQLGNGTTTNSRVPVKVSGLSDVSSIAVGEVHNIVLKKDGTVWTWGSNSCGELGNGTEGLLSNKTTPIQVPNLTDVLAIAAGGAHSVVLKNNGKVWAWGMNYYRQLGDGTYIDRSTPIQVQNLNDVSAITAGSKHTVAQKSDGTVWAWGDNSNRQLGDGSTTERRTLVQVFGLSNITSISAGEDHTVALKQDGTAWAWGSHWGGTESDNGSPAQIIGLSIVTSIASGKYTNTLAVKSDGTVWAWGSNNYGQLGDETLTVSYRPIQVLGTNGVGYLNLGSIQSFIPEINKENEKQLTAYSNNGVVYISGLKIGLSLIVYNINGMITYKGIATEEKMEVQMLGRGMYIVTNGKNTVKILDK